ncbi:serine-type endopeptidase activity [Nesidiocoris tenuis]|uniref:Serine-type endopeptidase activity n=1 Tax=Nesidiocoris tenuis TaxID=355587 RepID=A0ABN7AL98_9HEMI|nr:serine-type endopeptidase activity [Nesidiocoris tenuis]
MAVSILETDALKILSSTVGRFERSAEDNDSRLAEEYSTPESAVNAPFVVALVAVSLQAFCTGSIINKQWVVTAAHCVVKRTNRNMKVIAGADHVSQFGNNDSIYQHRFPSKIKIHREHSYQGESFHDIALIRVDRPFVFNSRVAKVRLWAKEWPVSFYRFGTLSCNAFGWGTLDGKTPSTLLRTANIRARHGRLSCPCFQSDYRLICSGGSGSSGVVCPGDSGGPLICRKYLAGITRSFYSAECKKLDGPHQCSISSIVDTWTYVCPFLGFINKHVPGVSRRPANCKSPRSYNVPTPLLAYVIMASTTDIINATPSLRLGIKI